MFIILFCNTYQDKIIQLHINGKIGFSYFYLFNLLQGILFVFSEVCFYFS